MASDSLRGLTVRAAAREMGVHVQTMRRTVREAEVAGYPVAIKIMGEHGPEWRLCPLVVWALHRESDPEQGGGPNLRPADSSPGVHPLHRVEALLVRLTEGQRVLLPSPEELQARADREARIAAALEAGPEVRDLAEELGRVTAARDQARAEAEKLREELREERGRAWWRRLIGQ